MTVQIWHPTAVDGMYPCSIPKNCPTEQSFVKSEDHILVLGQLQRMREILLAEYENTLRGSEFRAAAYDLLRELETCEECNAYDRVHDHRCPFHPDHDPTRE